MPEEHEAQLYDQEGPIEDIQHDLAMFIADGEDNDPLAIDFRQTLERQGAAIPTNCRWEHNVYAPFGQSLKYDLEVPHA